MTDQTALLQVALDGGQEDFLGETYELHGQVTVPLGAKIKDLKATVPNWDANRKVFHIPDATDVEIDGLCINIGSDPSKGDLVTSRALDVLRGQRATFKNIEVSGHGRGTYVFLHDLIDSTIEDIRLHDGQHNAVGGPEQLIGLWLMHCRRVQIVRPRVSNLLNASGRPYQTDGVTLGGCIDVTISDCDIEMVGEGIDATGTFTNVRVKVNGGVLRDCDSFAVKFANAAQECEANGVLALRAGYAGFIISGQNEAGNLALCHGNRIVDCEARDTCVGNSNWSALHTAGIRIEQGSYLTAYPSGNEVVNFKAISAAAKYGALTQTSGNTLSPDRVIVGATVAATTGPWS